MSNATAPIVAPPGTLPTASDREVQTRGVRCALWDVFEGGRLRVVAYARPLAEGGFLAYARDCEAIYAEGSTVEAALLELGAVAREVVRIYAERGVGVPVSTVDREPGDELIGSFVVDA